MRAALALFALLNVVAARSKSHYAGWRHALKNTERSLQDLSLLESISQISELSNEFVYGMHKGDKHYSSNWDLSAFALGSGAENMSLGIVPGSITAMAEVPEEASQRYRNTTVRKANYNKADSERFLPVLANEYGSSNTDSYDSGDDSWVVYYETPAESNAKAATDEYGLVEYGYDFAEPIANEYNPAMFESYALAAASNKLQKPGDAAYVASKAKSTAASKPLDSSAPNAPDDQPDGDVEESFIDRVARIIRDAYARWKKRYPSLHLLSLAMFISAFLLLVGIVAWRVYARIQEKRRKTFNLTPYLTYAENVAIELGLEAGSPKECSSPTAVPRHMPTLHR